MRGRLAVWLRWLAERLDPQDALITSARAIVAQVDMSDRRGAYKAALALTEMRKAHPGEKDSRLKWAIETAVQLL